MKTQSDKTIEYYSDAKIKCACGNVITVGSTKKDMQTEICSACHPLYTGQKKVLDAAGRVERFKSRFAKFEQFKTQKSPKTTPSKKKPAKS